ncbi:hypothetical protein M438DRAFT_358800 [Aureobasidium pullulans EXF-150]|uniref:Uncharacterized protein n=1 Tax=Aureobasidium pullulans EXF-150 TaxID=1043002 RepID=A0A074X4N0_AURPU|nr:uncharacterized protein M438DRAFT_358800 [Aureobasidium pullulans EXF-150]KEQ80343.1 hypothetical protein M438DRAFT_358800 [Aureobasidium pullulans EXF-150]
MPPLHENMTDYEILQEEISVKVQELEILRRKLAIEYIKRRRKGKKEVQQQTTDEEENREGAENEDDNDTRATNAGRAAPGSVASAMEVDMKNVSANTVTVKPEPEDEEDRPAGFIDMVLKKPSKPSNPSSKPVGLVFNDEKPQAPLPPKQTLRRTRCVRQRHLAPELPMPDPARELNRPPTKRPATTAAASSPHSNGSPNPSPGATKVKAKDKTEAQPRPLASKRRKTASTPSSHTLPSPPFLTPPSRHLSSPSLPAPPSPAASSSSCASSPSPPRKPSLSPPVENALSFSFEAGDVPQEPRPAYSGTQINKERERGKKGEKRKIVMLGVDGSTKVVEG